VRPELALREQLRRRRKVHVDDGIDTAAAGREVVAIGQRNGLRLGQHDELGGRTQRALPLPIPDPHAFADTLRRDTGETSQTDLSTQRWIPNSRAQKRFRET